MAEQRELKNRTRISTTLSNSTYQRLREFSSQTDVPITKIFDRAIEMYLDSIKK